ncbi:hypothetical protein P3S68_028401 [Capsicum galapagoense]
MIQTQKCICSEDVALTVIKCYAKNSMVDKAMGVFQNMKYVFGCVPGVRSFNTLLNAFVISNQESGKMSDVYSYGTFIYGLAKDGFLGEALKVFDEMFERELCGKFNEGLELWNRMKRNAQKMNLFTCCALIHGLCELGNVNGAERIFKKMIETGLSPDVVVYGALLNGYCKVGEIKKCFELWEVMGIEDCRNVTSYNILMRGLFENRMVDEAISIWKLMGENGNGSLNKALNVLQAENEGERCVDLYAYSSIVNGLCREGRLDEATAMLDLMAKQGCTLSSHVCNALIKASKVQEALRFFGEMHSQNCSPTVVTYNVLIDGLCKAERFGDAYELVEEMLKKGWTPDMITYSLLVDGLCRSKMVDLALKLLNQIVSKGLKPDVTMVNIIIHGLCSVGKLENTLQIFLSMSQWECLPNLVTYNTLMEGFYKARDCKNASAVWALILRGGFQPDISSYNITLKGLSSCHRMSDAILFFNDARKRKIHPTAVTWNILVRAVICG